MAATSDCAGLCAVRYRLLLSVSSKAIENEFSRSLERGVLFPPVDNHWLVALRVVRANNPNLIYIIVSDGVRFDPEHFSVNTR